MLFCVVEDFGFSYVIVLKRDVTEGDAKSIFSHFKSAKTIHEALVTKFGEGDDKTLKTKEFTKEVSFLWNKLQRKSGDDTATKMFLKFIDGLKDTKVKEIKEAKNVKGDLKVMTNPAVTEYNKTSTARNGTAATLLKIEERYSKPTQSGKLSDFVE